MAWTGPANQALAIPTRTPAASHAYLAYRRGVPQITAVYHSGYFSSGAAP